MAATLFKRNGRIRVWAMTPPGRDAYVSFEPVTSLGFVMTDEDLNALIHDISSAQRVVKGIKTNGKA